jgi:hypothetical protein
MMASSKEASSHKRHLVVRQAAIIGSLAAVMVVIGVAAIGIYSGRLPDPFSSKFSSASPTQLTVAPPPCPVDPDAKYPAPVGITINVLNSTDKQGAAGAAAQALRAYEFTTSAESTSVPYAGSVRLVAGLNGLANAYTVLLYAPQDAELTLDLREDATVDLIIGAEYKGLPKLEMNPFDPDKVLVQLPSCEDAGDIAKRLQDAQTKPSSTPTEQPPATENQPTT